MEREIRGRIHLVEGSSISQQFSFVTQVTLQQMRAHLMVKMATNELSQGVARC